MPRRTSLALGLAAVLVLAALAGLLGSRSRATPGSDSRPSTLLTLPNGSAAVAEAAGRLGVVVDRLRQHQLRPLMADPAGNALVVLDPTLPLTGAQIDGILGLPAAGVALVVAGPSSRALFRCFGFDTLRLRDSLPVGVSGPASARPARVGLALRPTGQAEIVDSSGLFDSVIRTCRVPVLARLDTLAVAGGLPVALRLSPADGGAPVTLIADVGLFRNRAVRDTDAGPLVLGWLAEYDHLWFDEDHHGFLAGGSLLAWTLRWSRESPWGWLAFHLAIVGLLALASRAVRFGPVVTTLDRRRRSVVEHVRALALALRSAGGHGRAIGLLIAGVRRRLTPGTRGSPGGSREWLERLSGPRATPVVAGLAARLLAIDHTHPSEAEVLTAGKLVEDLWNGMKR